MPSSVPMKVNARRAGVMVLLLIGLWQLASYAGTPLKGPYLIYTGDPTQMMVLWHLSTDQDCEISWGNSTEYDDGSLTCNAVPEEHMGLSADLYGSYGPLGFQYQALLTELPPSTRCYYKVDFGDYVIDGSFITAPSTDTETVRFLAWADTQFLTNFGSSGTLPPGVECFSEVAEQTRIAIEQDPSLQTMLLLAGDWVADGVERSWSRFFRNRYVRSVLELLPIQGARGNHDVFGFGQPFENAGDVYGKYCPILMSTLITGHSTTGRFTWSC